MDKIPTAQEFRTKATHRHGGIGAIDFIEFAKLHVKAALKAACENADMTEYSYQSAQEGSTMEIDKNSILNAYPLENIK